MLLMLHRPYATWISLVIHLVYWRVQILNGSWIEPTIQIFKYLQVDAGTPYQCYKLPQERPGREQ
jgi:hypothetical protein